MTVGDTTKALIYQSKGGTVTGTTALNAGCNVNQYFIDRDKVIVPSSCRSMSTVSVYNYPAGDAPIQTIAGFKSAFGAVVSR